MSSYAIGAAGMLSHSGRIEDTDHAVDVRNEATARHVEIQARSHGKVCPHCLQRIAVGAFETHVLLAHQAVTA